MAIEDKPWLVPLKLLATPALVPLIARAAALLDAITRWAVFLAAFSAFTTAFSIWIRVCCAASAERLGSLASSRRISEMSAPIVTVESAI